MANLQAALGRFGDDPKLKHTRPQAQSIEAVRQRYRRSIKSARSLRCKIMKSSWIKNLSLLIISTLIAFLVAEAGTRVLIGHPLEITGAFGRASLYQRGENFQNVGSIFKYFPNKKIHTAFYYIIGRKAIEEYTYVIETNNLGLVQKTEIKPETTADLLLGDSFTEGVGASPWFYQLESNNSGRQIINGGVIGTGPLQWEALKNHLVAEYSIKFKKINVILIGGDIHRDIWNFNAKEINCLRNAECDRGMHLWGFDFLNKTDRQAEDDVLNMYRRSRLLHVNPSEGFTFVKNTIRNSAFLYQLYSLSKRWKKSIISTLRVDDANLEAIKRLTNAGELPGFTLLIPQKHEAREFGLPVWDSDGRRVIKWFEENNVHYDICNLQPADYNQYDPHPNAGGHQKIEVCVLSLL